MDRRKIITQVVFVVTTTLLSPLMQTAYAKDEGNPSKPSPTKSGADKANPNRDAQQARQAQGPSPTPPRPAPKAATPSPEGPTVTATPSQALMATDKSEGNPSKSSPTKSGGNKANPNRHAQQARQAQRPSPTPRRTPTRAAPSPEEPMLTAAPSQSLMATDTTGGSLYLGAGIGQSKMTFNTAYTTDFSLPSVNLPSESQNSHNEKTSTTGNLKLGYQLDFSRLTLGVETFAARGNMDIKASPIRIERNRPDSTFKTRLNDLEGASVLAGIKLNSRFAVFGKGGVVRGHVQSSYQSILGNPQQFTDRSNLNGYLVGGGVEYRLSRHFAVRAEYEYDTMNSITIESTQQDSTGPGLASPLLRADPLPPNLTRTQHVKIQPRAKAAAVTVIYRFGNDRRAE